VLSDALTFSRLIFCLLCIGGRIIRAESRTAVDYTFLLKRHERCLYSPKPPSLNR
jgi:hypothetical protein